MMTTPLTDLALLSVAVGVVSLTITHTPLTKGIRHQMIGWPLMLGELANCPYCMAHWIALMASWMLIGGTLVEILVNALVLTGGAALYCGILLRLFLFREGENEDLRELIAECKQELDARAQHSGIPDYDA